MPRKKRTNDDEKTSQKRKTKRKKSSHSKSKSKENSFFKKIKKILLIIIIIALVLFVIWRAIEINKWKKISQDVFKVKNSEVYDLNQNIIAEIGGERKQIKTDNIPSNIKNAYVAIEDERFYKHHGVDIKRTTAAIGSYIFHKGSSSFGGSTITQQLVKNITGDSENSISRKIKEWAMAFELECFYDKDEIINTYLNIIYVGPNVYGVGAGAKYYFDKDIQDLSVAEGAYLAGLNHSPNSYQPFSDKDNSEKIEKRTKTVLSQMLKKKYISQEEHDNAVKEVEDGLKFKNGEIKTKNNGVYSYHTDAMIAEIISELKEKKHISEEFATNYLYYGGLKIYGTQDTGIQEDIENEFEKSKYILSSKKDKDATSQAAMVIMNQKNGQVVGCAGGLGKKKTAREFNRATMSLRQTGSASKPFAVVGPAIAAKKITATTIYDDVATKFVNLDGSEYAPEDYDPYQGEITVRRAIESSQNIPFVKIIEEIKPSTSIKYLKKMGVKNLTKKDNNLALALGGEEKGLSPLEMAAAYSTIANDGKYIEPTFYTRVTNESGEDILKTKQKTRRVFSKEVAFILKSLLKQPVEGAKGTATYCAINGMDVAAKTGTTNENYDKWLCGFTNNYTAATWFGYDMNESINFGGNNPAGIIWSEVMKKVHSNIKGTRFEMPSGIKTAKVCKKTGLVASDSCEDTYTEYYLFGTVPKKCTDHNGKRIEKTNTTVETKEEKEEQNIIKDEEEKKTETKNETTKNTTTTNKQENKTQNVSNNTKNNTSNDTKKNTTNTNSSKNNNTINSTTKNTTSSVNGTE